jgi:hypothetical protein
MNRMQEVSLQEAARRLDYSTVWVKALIREGRIKGRRVEAFEGDRRCKWAIQAASIAAYIRERRKRRPPQRRWS